MENLHEPLLHFYIFFYDIIVNYLTANLILLDLESYKPQIIKKYISLLWWQSYRNLNIYKLPESRIQVRLKRAILIQI